MPSAAARIHRIAVGIGATLVLVGCVLPPPGDPQGGPSSPGPSSTAGAYRYTTESTGTDAWSFEPTSVEVVQQDSLGTAAAEGFQLVVLRIDGEMLFGDAPDFYRQFRVAAYDEESAGYYGLSSGGTFLAEDSLFDLGKQPVFEGAQAIFHMPIDWSIEHWYFLHHSTGEQWLIDVQVR